MDGAQRLEAKLRGMGEGVYGLRADMDPLVIDYSVDFPIGVF